MQNLPDELKHRAFACALLEWRMEHLIDLCIEARNDFYAETGLSLPDHSPAIHAVANEHHCAYRALLTALPAGDMERGLFGAEPVRMGIS